MEYAIYLRLRFSGLWDWWPQACFESHTAIAIADRRRRIVLVNPVFVQLCGHANGNNGALLGCLLENVLCLSSQDAIILSNCFQETCTAEAEFHIGGRVMHVQISPSSADSESSDRRNRFVVVLKHVTEERALERVIESAQEQATRTRAIMDAIAALTQRLPSPAPQPPAEYRNLAMRPAISDETRGVYFRQMDDAGEMGPVDNDVVYR
jgi:hypothetical protein